MLGMPECVDEDSRKGQGSSFAKEQTECISVPPVVLEEGIIYSESIIAPSIGYDECLTVPSIESQPIYVPAWPGDPSPSPRQLRIYTAKNKPAANPKPLHATLPCFLHVCVNACAAIYSFTSMHVRRGRHASHMLGA
jgi:hypothetical protein